MSDPKAAPGTRTGHVRHIQHGKWSEPGVPHSGWMCTGVTDLGAPLQQCEMCELQTVRYVHQMWHPGYPITLDVGCDCAGEMEGNLAEATRRDDEMRKRASRLKTFLTKGWTEMPVGVHERVIAGLTINVREHSTRGWSASVHDPQTSNWRTSKETYASLEAIKVAAFKIVEQIRRKRAEARAESTERSIEEGIEGAHRMRASTRVRGQDEPQYTEAELRVGMRIVNGRLRPIQ